MKHTLIAFVFMFLGCSNPPKISLEMVDVLTEVIPYKKVYTAGDVMVLAFTTTSKINHSLLLSNAFGSVVVFPEKESQELRFHIPQHVRRKSGPCSWRLLSNGKSILKGVVNIHPKIDTAPRLETYFGPRSMTAGPTDYSMLINVTTDPYDNVLPSGTEVVFKSQFLNTISEFEVPSKNLISWKKIHSKIKAGRILVNTSYKDKTSKELTTIIFPSTAEPFTIEAKHNHSYADGNQVLKLNTSIIRDQYDNMVSDGTLVSFSIENSKGVLLQSSAPTIGGIANATMLHPSEKEVWKITAYVTGAAKSNTITILFNTAIKDYEVHFSTDKRTIKIGPLRSFMGQLAPDGILITAALYSKTGEYLETIRTNVRKGSGTIELQKEYYPNASYHIVIKAAGITKTYDLIYE